MPAEIVVTSNQFMILGDDHPVSITDDRKKAEQIACHFTRLQPASKIIIHDTAANFRYEI